MKKCPATEKIVSSVNLRHSHVVNFPNYVFLCGGELAKRDGSFASCRGFFDDHLSISDSSLKSHILLSEPVVKSFDKDVYADLLTFEKDIASLCLLTVLFAESPGSFTELGSFAVFEGIQEKLLIVIDKDYAHPVKGSFIWDGAITYLDKKFPDSPRVPYLIYEWDKDGTGKVVFDKAADTAAHLEQAINDVLAEQPKQILFKGENAGHVMLMITELLNITLVATAGELLWLLEKLGVGKHTRKRMNQYLRLLTSVGLVDCYSFGEDYFCSKPGTQRIRFSIRKGVSAPPSDLWPSSYVAYYEKEDRQRFKLWKKHFESCRDGVK